MLDPMMQAIANLRKNIQVKEEPEGLSMKTPEEIGIMQGPVVTPMTGVNQMDMTAGKGPDEMSQIINQLPPGRLNDRVKQKEQAK